MAAKGIRPGSRRLRCELETLMAQVGFGSIRLTPKDESEAFIEWAPGHMITGYVVSATMEAVRPSGESGCCC